MQDFDKNFDANRDSNATVNILLGARAGMIVAAQHVESGLSESNHVAVRARILEVTTSQNGTPQVHVDSSGLSLDQKLFIERVLLRQLDAEELPAASIYFRRASKSQVSSEGPQQVTRKAPFGLNIRKKPIDGTSAIIAVASGKGGVGKSTVAANLAVALAGNGLRVGLMDCDVYGPSAQLLLGLKGSMQVSSGRLKPLERHGVKVVSFGFLTDVKSPVIWRGPLVSKAIEQLCYDVDWGTLDVMILDLPPGTGDVQLTLAERIPLTGVVIVSTPQQVALVDAHKAVSMFEQLGIPVIGAVENMAFHACRECGNKEHLFGSEDFEIFLKDRHLRRLGSIPLSRDVRVASDLGEPVAAGSHTIGQEYRAIAQVVSDHIRQNKHTSLPVEATTNDSHHSNSI